MEKHLLNTKSLRMVFFLSLFLSSFVNSYSQTYECYVGEVRNLPEPTPPKGSFMDITGEVTTTKPDNIQTYGSLKIYVHKYFSGTATVSVPYKYSYWSSVTNRMEPGDATAYYSIKCKPTTIKLKKSEIEVGVGGYADIEYETDPSNVELRVTYSSSNNNIASVEPDDNIIPNKGGSSTVTGVSEGTCYVTVKGNTGNADPRCTIKVVDNMWLTTDVGSGSVFKGTKVAINCKKSGATIYYTTDGTEPNRSCKKYTEPIVLTESITLKAKAYLGDKESKTISRDYSVYTHKAGDVFETITVEGVKLTMKAYKSSSYICLQVGDGSSLAINPSYAGTITIPSSVDDMLVEHIAENAFRNASISEVVVPGNHPNKIYSNAFEGCNNLKRVLLKGDNPVSIYDETFKNCSSLESFSYSGNATISFSNKSSSSRNVFANCNNIKNIYCGGTNGPVKFDDNIFTDFVYNSATLYVEKGRVEEFKTTSGWKNFINIREIGNETNPKLTLSASPSGGSVESDTKVYLTAKADGSTVSSADIYYTTNGTTPSKSSNKYTSSGISISQACKLKAIAYKDGYDTSEVGSWSYTIKSSTVEPTSISVSPSTKTIEVGETFTPTYSLTPSNASTTVTWSSDDSSIASVDSNTGLVTGIKAGKTYINAKTANGKEDWCKVTVTVPVNPIEPESSDPNINQIALGGWHSLILKTDGTLWTCGYNNYGQLGDGTTTDRKTPIKVISDVAQVSAGDNHTMIVKADGTLWACGYNNHGQLGDGTTTNRKTPVKVMYDVAQVSAGYEHTMILKSDGTLWACGYNYYGQLGDGTTIDRKTPVKVLTDVAQVSAGASHTMILKTDGTLWACGSNSYGQLGDGTITGGITPVKVMSDVAQVSAGYEHTMILKTDGTLWACGNGGYGSLSDDTTTDRETPVKMMSDVAQVSANYHDTMILKTDWTLWACGDNDSGRLGDGTTIDRKIPVKVMSDVAQVSAGFLHTMILKADGTLWACGSNRYGQLGDGTTTGRTSFVKIAEPNIKGDEITVKTSNFGYVTFYSTGFAYTLPNGLSAQVVTNANSSKLTYKTIADGSVSGVIPAGTAVMLVSDNKQSGTYTLTSTDSKVSYSGTNFLRGSDEATTTTGNGYHYKLSYGQSGSNLSNVFGWYWGAQNGAPFQIEGHKAWLVVPKSSSSTRGFAIGGEATGIEMVSGDDEADAVYYDLQGRRITKPTVKGVYIMNGKKVVINQQ